MKKLLISAALLIAFSATKAQINKGQWLVGGDVSFSSDKQGEAKSTSFEFSPNAGYFFMNNFAGGLRLSFTSSKQKGADEGYSTFMAAPFLRYYFLPTGQKVNILLDGSYGFGSMGGDDKQSLSGFSFAAGPAVFLTPNTALEFTLGYNSMKLENVDDRANAFGVNVGFQIHLGGK